MYPDSTEVMPSNRLKTASMHQKQPPPKIAVCSVCMTFRCLCRREVPRFYRNRSMDYEPEIEEHHIHTVRAALCSAQGAGLKYLSKGYVRYETPTDHTVGVVFRDDSAGSLNPQTT